MTRITARLSMLAVAAILLMASMATPAAAAKTNVARSRRIEANSPTKAPAPKPKHHPKKKDTAHQDTTHHHTSSSHAAAGGGGGSGGGGGGSGGGGGASGGGGGGGLGPASQAKSPLHGSSRSFGLLISSAIGAGLLVAGLAYKRQRDYVNSEASHEHTLKGSVRQRMSTFSHLVEVSSRSSGGKGGLSKDKKARLVRQLSKGKSERQVGVEEGMKKSANRRGSEDFEMDVYMRATDEESALGGPGIVVV